MVLCNSRREKDLLSVVVPAYCEEETVSTAAKTIVSVLESAQIPFEIVFVDDGSGDGTWRKITEQSEIFPQVRGVRFSRNFGKEAAIFSGLAQSRGACTVVIDCDLQHPPEKIIEMYEKWLEGFQIVEGVKESRGKESLFHRCAAKTFYQMISKNMGIDMSNASDFKLLDRRAVEALLAIGEKDAFFRGLSSWIGFTTTQVTFVVQERVAGESKWSLFSLVKYAMRNLASFSIAPLQVIPFLGFGFLLISLIFGGIALYQKFNGLALDGFTTVILLLLIIGGILLISLGFIAYYIGKIYTSIQDRPRFIIENDTEEGKKE
ncbi:MAG: glycosyltransferase family 2 protein [Eubacteriales bacterium]